MYFLLKSLFYAWSLLPMRVLHWQSSVVAFALEHLLGYRKRIILDNLRHSFPEKEEAELILIRREFYRNFCDVWVETVKLMSISRKNLLRRVRLVNPEILPEMTAHGRGGIAVFGHYCNWEWLAAGLAPQLPFETLGVYKPLSNRAFDRLMIHIRTRFGNDLVPMKETYRESLTRLQGHCYMGFLGDQTPLRHPKMYFTKFLGRPAPVHLGIATLCLKLDVPLYFFDIQKEKRGHYRIRFVHIPHQDLLPFSRESVHRLTDRHVQYLAGMIRRQPAWWLWSHRRWKHAPREGDLLSPLLADSTVSSAPKTVS